MKEVALSMAVAAIFLFIGFGMGRMSAATDCRHLGAFYEGRSTFDCRPRGEGK